MRVFLSYAREDHVAADEVTRWLDDKGVAFYDFRKPARHGGRFATSRLDALAMADSILILLSSSLLTSEWCKQDLSMGLEQMLTRSNPDATFLHVLQVADVPKTYEGRLREFDWLDCTTPGGFKSALQELSYRLGVERRPSPEIDDHGYQTLIKPGLPSVIAEPAPVLSEPSAVPDHAADDRTKKVMVICGPDSQANSALFDCLRAMGLQPQEWGQLIQQSQIRSPYIGAVLDGAFMNVQAVVALFTPDEYVTTRASHETGKDGWRLQATPNVLIAAGMAFATHPSETILLVLGDQELPSDLSEQHFIRLDGTGAAIKSLADRLTTAGCAVELDGTDWLNPARFPSRDDVKSRPARLKKPPEGQAPRTSR
jgi:hypothetical protein